MLVQSLFCHLFQVCQNSCRHNVSKVCCSEGTRVQARKKTFRNDWWRWQSSIFTLHNFIYRRRHQLAPPDPLHQRVSRQIWWSAWGRSRTSRPPWCQIQPAFSPLSWTPPRPFPLVQYPPTPRIGYPCLKGRSESGTWEMNSNNIVITMEKRQHQW